MSFKPLTFHVLGVSPKQTTKEWAACCPLTANLRSFCKVLKSLGHTVYLYASEENDAPCDELITCITKDEIEQFCNIRVPEDTYDNHMANWTHDSIQWVIPNGRAIQEIRLRQQDGDFLATASGKSTDVVKDAFPNLIGIEYAAGYQSISDKNHHAFPSYSWMHTLLALEYDWAVNPGRMHDRVIPHNLDINEFTYSEDKEDYLLFIGRLVPEKGVIFAADVASALGIPFVVAGFGDFLPEDVDYRGFAGPEERNELMSKAKALFTPSACTESFGMTSVEALACGTPIITPNWGGQAEININGITGFTCNTIQDFVEAVKNIDTIDPRNCRQRAERYDINTVKWEYQKWFDDLTKLRESGWYDLPPEERIDIWS